jgi:Mg2+/Co2+ transporter CorC
MSETLKSALITGFFMLAAIVCNEFAYRLREVWNRKKVFFKDFFPERLKAYQEIMRTITESGISKIMPGAESVVEIKETLNIAQQKIEDVAFRTQLLVDTKVTGFLFGLAILSIKAADAVSEYGNAGEFEDALDILHDEYYELIELLRKKSGVDIIDQEFAKVLKGSEDVVKKEKKKLDKYIHGKKKRP